MCMREGRVVYTILSVAPGPRRGRGSQSGVLEYPGSLGFIQYVRVYPVRCDKAPAERARKCGDYFPSFEILWIRGRSFGRREEGRGGNRQNQKKCFATEI